MDSIILHLFILAAFSGARPVGGSDLNPVPGSCSVDARGGVATSPHFIQGRRKGSKRKKSGQPDKPKKLKITGTLVDSVGDTLIVEIKSEGQKKVMITKDTTYPLIRVRSLTQDPDYVEIIAHNDAAGQIIAEKVFIHPNRLSER